MTDGHIGRLVAASLHQAITEELPGRLEFYENWLHSEGLRDGSIGRAPLVAVLGFLRTEGDAYDRVVERAGVLAAEWGLMSVGPYRQRVTTWVPRRFRLGPALRVVRLLAGVVDHQSRVRVSTRGSNARLEVASSVFCSVRGVHAAPLCGFYRALAVTTLARFGLVVTAHVDECRAVGGGSCVVSLRRQVTQPIETAAAA